MRHGIPARQIAFCSNRKTSFDTPDLWTHFFDEVALESNDRFPSFCRQIGSESLPHFEELNAPRLAAFSTRTASNCSIL